MWIFQYKCGDTHLSLNDNCGCFHRYNHTHMLAQTESIRWDIGTKTTLNIQSILHLDFSSSLTKMRQSRPLHFSPILTLLQSSLFPLISQNSCFLYLHSFFHSSLTSPPIFTISLSIPQAKEISVHMLVTKWQTQDSFHLLEAKRWSKSLSPSLSAFTTHTVCACGATLGFTV